MSANLPATPSAFPGYHTLQSRSDYQAAERSVRRFWKGMNIFFGFSVLVFLVILVNWDYEILRWANFFALIAAFVCSACIWAVLGAILENPEKRRDAIRNEHVNKTLSLIVQTVRDRTNPQSSWRWLPLHNAGSTLFFTENLMGVINLDADRILYVYPSNITDCKIESRNVGSTTHTQGSAVTVGGYGGHVLGGYTTSSATHSTEQYYSHVVDVYTKLPSFNHLPLYFGGNEAYAKEAYGRLRAMTLT